MEGTDQERLNADQPRKKGLDPSIFLKPVAETDTSIGRIFLFPFRVPDVSEYAKLPDQPSTKRIRGYLPFIASLSTDYLLDKERVGITAGQLDQLSKDEIEALAEAYASSSAFRETRENSRDRVPLAEPRRKVWQQVDRVIDDFAKAKARCSFGNKELSRERLRQVRARVREMTSPTAEFSVVARWCFLMRNAPSFPDLLHKLRDI